MRGLGLKGFGLRVGFQTTTRASTGRTGFGVSYKANIILRIPRVIPSNSPNVVRTPPPLRVCAESKRPVRKQRSQNFAYG